MKFLGVLTTVRARFVVNFVHMERLLMAQFKFLAASLPIFS
jgi:hypothetical protein